MTEKEAAQIFKALGDENRIHILQLICDGEKCACKLLEQLNISQPTLSHHMKILCDSQLVNSRKEGKWIHYSVNCEKAKEIKDLFKVLSNIHGKACPCEDK